MKVVPYWVDKTVGIVTGSGSANVGVQTYSDGVRQSYYITVSSSVDPKTSGRTWAEQ